MDSKRVMAAEGGGGAAALWQQLHAYMENRFGSSRVSVTEGASHSPCCPERLKQKDKIESDVRICPPRLFVSRSAFATQSWSRHVLQVFPELYLSGDLFHVDC